MIAFADCQDIRKMAVIKEINCLKCGAKDGIEVFERDSQPIGDSVCDQCGFTIPEGVTLEFYDCRSFLRVPAVRACLQIAGISNTL